MSKQPTVKTLSAELKEAGICVNSSTIHILFNEGFESVEILREDPITFAEFKEMKINGYNAKKLVKHFSANAGSTSNTGENVLDLMKNDPEAFTWRKIKHLTPKMVEQFVDDFFINTANRRRPGYAFMEEVARGSYKPPVAKLQGEISEKGTLKLVLALIKGNARFDRGLFVVGPREKYVPVSLADMNIKLLKIDPLDPNSGYLNEGSGEGFRGVQFYTDNWVDFVLSQKVQEFLALAYANGELDKGKAIKIADDIIRGKEKKVRISDLRWVLEQTFDEVSVTGGMKMPSLEGNPKKTPRRQQQQQRQNVQRQSQKQNAGFSVTPQELVQIISGYYSLGEIKTLAFDMRIDHEDLEGRTKNALARSLVQFCQRHQKIEILATKVYANRPHAFS